jgi:hypothetical protein
MNCWLVIDLRSNRFSAAIIDLSSGMPRWIRQQVRIYPRPDIYNDVFETDLAFFRGPDDKTWTPTLISAIENLPPEFEKIPALLNEETDRLSKLLIRCLRTLLRDLLKEYQELPLVFLIDQNEIEPLLNEFSTKVNQASRIYLIPNLPGDFEGFALLDTAQGELPEERSIFSCIVDTDEHTEETWFYLWSHQKFERVETGTTELSPQSRWDTAIDLQRAGLAILCLFWQEHAAHHLEQEMIMIEQKNHALTQVLTEMIEIQSRLRSLQISMNGK